MSSTRPFEFVLILALLSSCTGPLVKETVETRRMEIGKIDLTRIRFHRPSSMPTGPGEFALPGEPGSEPRVRQCVAPGAAWAGLMKGEREIRDCLNGLKSGQLAYRFIKQEELELRFEGSDPSGQESCLSRLLPTIPLPREIYFHGARSGNAEEGVFAVSFEPKVHSPLPWRVLTPDRRILIPVPPARRLETRADLEVWMLSVMFSLFPDEKGSLHASYVPEFDAKNCFGSESDAGRPGVFWP
jgi:hypothetical protein